MEFAALASILLAQSRTILPSWLPAGKWRGAEFVVGNLAGAAGESLSINANTGAWADFASGEKGGDLISLHAAMHHLSQGDAAAQLEKLHTVSMPAVKPAKRRRVITPVPADAPACNFSYYNGTPSHVWDYRATDGALLGYVARYDLGDGKKDVIPWTYSEGDNGKREWRCGSWTSPRPLYGLHDLAERPHSPVLLVEGEKSADAARKLTPTYVVMTWPGGAKSWNKADWKPLAGRKILLWPDADDAGLMAMWAIGRHLFMLCPEVKIILPDSKPQGWDAADAVAEGWDGKRFVEWAKPLAQLITDTGAAKPATAPAASAPARPQTIVGRWMEWGLLGPNNSASGKPFADLNNTVRVLEVDPFLHNKVWYDEFLGRILTISNPHPREWRDVDDVDLTLYLQREIGLQKIGTNIVAQAVMQVAYRNVKNCVKDWLGTLTWDQEPRIDHFFEDHFGAAGTLYTRAASRNFFLSLIARACQPGCKADNVIVLEGEQGLGKSRALQILGGEWFTEQHESASNLKAFGEILQGKWLIEISELDAFGRGELTAVKGVITNPSDRFRQAYARRAEDHPRRCVFVGTTNKDDWHRDETGARRFWPIRCNGAIDVQAIAGQREQLFAEAVHRFNAGETWFEMPPDETRVEQRKRYDADVWLEAIQAYVALKSDVTVVELLTECLSRKLGEITHSDKLRVTACLRAMAWTAGLERSSGVVRRVWRRSDG